jgi:tRNA pseudouridine55 synthase
MENKEAFGFILINKPIGPSSHYIINQLRKITSIKKIGHAGTLDPFASGLLIVAIGRPATKNINQFVKLDKQYQTEVILGKETDSYDKTGKIINKYLGKKISLTKIKLVLNIISKTTTQIPPMYSAKKINGQKLYVLARKNIEIKRQAQKIKIYNIKILNYSWPKLKLEIYCSSGTYIRAIAHDLGEFLGCGACLNRLKRISIGKYSIKKSKQPKKLNPENWQKYLFNI